MSVLIPIVVVKESAITGVVQELDSLVQSEVNKMMITHDSWNAHSIGRITHRET